MKCHLLLLTMVSIACQGQTPATGKAETKGTCSPAVSGNQNTFMIKCGIGEKQGSQMIEILNKILSNQISSDAVIAKLDEILKTVNQNLRVTTYACNGSWRSSGPGANAEFEMASGSGGPAFDEMLNLYRLNEYTNLLVACHASLISTPGWLTPNLMCGLAYLGLGNESKAKEVLAVYEARKGPAYDRTPCNDIATYLQKRLNVK